VPNIVNKKEPCKREALFIEAKLLAFVGILSAVPRTTLEEIIVGLDVGCEVNYFASGKLLDCIKHDRVTMMIGAFPVTGESYVADIFAAFGSVRRGHFIFREDSRKWTFRYTSAAINTGIRVDIDPWEFIDGVAGYHTFNGANVNATAVTNA